ncbi:MAG: DegV family protein [Asgard group archaeon]|nr:DegV family protein [Asgard group archaeon]
MSKIAIITDGSCDIPKDLVDRYKIHIVPFRVVFGEKAYKTFGDWGDLSKEEFYKKLQTCEENPTSAIPSPRDIHDVYQKALNEADSVICIFLSNNFSGLFQEAVKVKQLFHGKDITLVDSTVTTSSMGALVLHAAKMVENGYTKEQILLKLEELKQKARLLVILDSVDGVYRSGRVGWAKKFLVSSFKIKPIVNFKDGLIVPGGTLIGRKEVIKRLKFVAPIIVKQAITDYIFIWHVNYPELANELYKIMNSHNNGNKEIIIQKAGPVVGTHVGEKSIGFMYIGDYKKRWILKMQN